MGRKLEVIVLNEIDSIEAERAGADRLELVTNMEAGGLSPNLEVVEAVVNAVSIPVNVMVRFTADNFVYDEEQFAQLLDYISKVKQLAINGIVFGSLDVSGKIEPLQLLKVIAASRDLELTYHRAIDEHDQFYDQNSQVIDGLVTNVLTSGGLSTPIEQNISRFTAFTQTRVLAGGGINADNYQYMIENCPDCDFHIGSLAYNQGDFTAGINHQAIRDFKAKLN